jgi:DMSO/TMAO reductase YedYZ molybdopterin-dependent catalytic subunit
MLPDKTHSFLKDARTMPRINRRDVIRMAALGMPVFAALESNTATADPVLPPVGSPTPDGLVVRQISPDNLESPFGEAITEITPTPHFFIRSHFAVANIEVHDWALSIEGHVENPLAFTLDQLSGMKMVTQQATLECAGNSRSYLTPTTKGVQWTLGAVGNAEWTGVRLSDLLKRAKVKHGAIEVICEGADSGEIKDPPKPNGPIHFARSMPLTRAMSDEVLIALKMNGAPLPVSHGFPARLLVPGWYGAASVKWLSRIIVTDTPFTGHFQTVDYAYWQRRNGLPNRTPVTEMQVKAEISRPAAGETVDAGKSYRISGAAWTGDAQIAKVEISDDGGKTWETARLVGKSNRHAWRLWEFDWKVPAAPGSAMLLARATDSRGNTQPMQRQPDRENYMINHLLPIKVMIH